jgi:4'-phosphopantetheinyl transferase
MPVQRRAELTAMAPSDLALAPGDVHVWRAVLDVPHACVGDLTGTIADEERARAERFVFPRDRDRFIVGRALLRRILGGYLGIDPRQLRFRYNHHRKPALADECAGGLRFNLSHAQGLALYAVTRGREIGIDLEQVDSRVSDEVLSMRSFSPPEVDALLAVPAASRKEAFFRYWTRKEAYVKGRGQGLSIPLQQFDVSRAPQEPVLAWDCAAERRDGSQWYIEDLTPGEGYAAALAVEGADRRVTWWHLPPQE